jgi:hypothetical protein
MRTLVFRRYPDGMENAAPAEEAGLIAGPAPGAAPAGDPAPAAEPAPASDGPAWRFVLQPRWLGWHLFMVVSFWGMLWLGDWQFHRALSGNGLSWAYTFEWPLFAGFAVVFWAKTIRDELRIRRGQALGPAEAELPLGVGAIQVSPAQSAAPGDDEDEDLTAYNAYLARLNSEVKNHGRWHGLR